MWQASDSLKKIGHYIEARGVPEELVNARLFQIAMTSSNDTASMKAIEMLTMRGAGRKVIEGFTDDDVLGIASFIETVLGTEAEDLRYIAGKIAQSRGEPQARNDYEGSIGSFPRFRQDEPTQLPLGSTQHAHDGLVGGNPLRQDQISTDSNASGTRQD